MMFVLWGFIGDPLWDDTRSSTLPRPNPACRRCEWSAALFLCGIIALVVVAIVLRFSGEAVANYLYNKLSASSPKLAHGVRSKIAGFHRRPENYS